METCKCQACGVDSTEVPCGCFWFGEIKVWICVVCFRHKLGIKPEEKLKDPIPAFAKEFLQGMGNAILNPCDTLTRQHISEIENYLLENTNPR